MVVRKLSTDLWTEPTQGTSYAVSSSIGTGTVVYNGSESSFTDENLTTGNTYDYKFYSENYNYYSAGVTASVTTGSGSSDYFRSKATGNWNTVATWESSVNNVNWIDATLYPTSSSNTTAIRNTHTVSMTATESSRLLTIESGGELVCGSHTFNLAANATLTNNGTFTKGTGKVSFSGSGSITGTFSFNEVDIAGSVNFGTNSTITGTLKILSGGYVNVDAPTYAAGSTLQYSIGGFYNRDVEWSQTSGSAYPCHVVISNNTYLNVNFSKNIARQIAGNLTIDAGSTFDMQDMTIGSTDIGVNIVGNIINNGEIKLSSSTERLKCSDFSCGSGSVVTLSTNFGGDIEVTGNYASGGTFTPNSRAMFFTGNSGDQSITRTGGETFDYVILDKSSGNLILNNDITINKKVTLTNGLVTTGSNKVIIATGADSPPIVDASSISYINGILEQTYSGTGTKSFPVGKGGAYRPLVLNFTSLTGSCTVEVEHNAADQPGTIPPGLSLVESRHWTVTATGGSGLNYFVTLDPDGHTVTGSTVILKNESGTNTKHSVTTPNITNSTAFSTLNGENAFALADDCSVEVTATSGTLTACYTTLKSAFDAINSGTHTGTLTVLVHGSTTETASATLNASGNGSASYTSLHLYPTTTGLSVSGNLNAPLIDLSGADNVTIDGRVNGAGSTKDLTLLNSNTGTSASTIRFINDACNNIVKYCKIKGATTNTTGGVVFFSTTTGTTGNDGNVIEYNDITGDGANRPVNGVYSEGTTGAANSGNEIRDNHLFNLLNLSLASNCVHISAENNNWTISDNSIFETDPLNPTASVDYRMIKIDAEFEENFLVSGNYLGGSSSSCGNIFIKDGSANNPFTAIYVNALSTIISANTIKNFQWTDSGKSEWRGITITGSDGNYTVGGNQPGDGNIIGDPTSTGSIVFRTGAAFSLFCGILSTSSGTINISYNKIGSIRTESSSDQLNNSFFGIKTDNRISVLISILISKNLVGSETVEGSITAASPAQSVSNTQDVFGIETNDEATIIIDDNIVANLINNATNNSSRLRGISTGWGSNNITNNLIKKLKTNASGVFALDRNVPLIGVFIESANSQLNVSGNLISELTNPNPSSTYTRIVGIFDFGNSASDGLLEKNYLSSFNTASTHSGSQIIGVTIQNSFTQYQTNIISFYSPGDSASVIGIHLPVNGTSRLVYNTVVIEGRAASPSFEAALSINDNFESIQNNLFYNGSIHSNHYSASIVNNYANSEDVDYNDFYGNLDLSPSGANNKTIDPLFQNAGGTSPADYKPLADGLLAIDIPTIPTDFFDSLRCYPNMGAIEPMTPVEDPVEITVKTGPEPVCKSDLNNTVTEYTTQAAHTNGLRWSISNLSAGSIGELTGIMSWTNGFSGSVYIQVVALGCDGPSDTVKRLVVIHDPDCEITGISATTTDSTGIVFTGSPGMTGYAWSISGNGTITSGTNAQAVEVTAGSTCDVSFTLTLTVTDSYGCSSTCTHTVTVTDGTPPTFTAPGPFSFCVIDIQTAIYDDPTMDITPERPEYFIYHAGEENFDVDPSSFSDNCCLDEDLILHWEIQFFGGTPGPIQGTGQPSTSLPTTQFPGSSGGDVTHTIRYRLEDCHGVFSAWQTANIVIKPRPTIIKDP